MARFVFPLMMCVTAVAMFCLPAAAADKEEKSVVSMFKGKLYDVKGNEVATNTLEGKIVGLYFADGSPNCKRITKALVNLRNLNKDKLEIVFVSADKSAEEQTKHMKDMKMPWPAVEFDGVDSKAFKKKYKAVSFPKLSIFSPKGQYVTDRGAGDVRSNVSSALGKWTRMMDK